VVKDTWDVAVLRRRVISTCARDGSDEQRETYEMSSANPDPAPKNRAYPLRYSR
jgi:hypothetical protein